MAEKRRQDRKENAGKRGQKWSEKRHSQFTNKQLQNKMDNSRTHRMLFLGNAADFARGEQGHPGTPGAGGRAARWASGPGGGAAVPENSRTLSQQR